MYNKKLSSNYSKYKQDFSTTDEYVLQQIKTLGINGSSILDLGCGDGRYLEMFKKMGAKNIIGVDNSAAMIESAKAKLSDDISVYEKSSDNLSIIKDSNLDMIFSNFVIHYLKDLLPSFLEVSRTLKKGGYFVFTYNIFETDNLELHNTEAPLLLGGKVTVVNLIKTHEEIKDALEKSGLEIITYENLDSSYLSLGESYKYAADITGITNILCISSKV